MRRFGRSKEEEDGNRSSLFSRKKDGRKEDNPYAQNPQNDPYSGPPMTAMQRAQADMGLPPGPRQGVRPGIPTNPAPRAQAPPPAYGSSPMNNGPGGAAKPGAGPGQGQVSAGYSAGGYGASNGYGASKYDNLGTSLYPGGPPSGRPPSYRSTADSVAGGGSSYGTGAPPRAGARRGGYGGMGGAGDDDNDPNRQALFGDAPSKYGQRSTPGGAAESSSGDASGGYGSSGGGGGGGGGYGSTGGGGYGGVGENRELTAEEQEDEDVKRMGDEVRHLRNETDQSLDRSLMVANQAIETAQGTMARMAHQRERLLGAEQNLNMAASHNKIAEHRTAELKHYNRSMFAVRVNNPFTSKQRAADAAQKALDEHRAEREMREETRRLAYQSNRVAEDNFTQVEKSMSQSRQLGQTRTGISNKFSLEDDDEEDIQKERQIDMKLGQLEAAVGTLNLASRAMGEFVEEDLTHIERIAQKSDYVDDDIRRNRYRLEQISRKA